MVPVPGASSPRDSPTTCRSSARSASPRRCTVTGPITAVYDWDSLTARPETTLVGVAALTFCTRFDLPGVRRAADPEEVRAFVAEYASARGTPLPDPERRRIAATATLLAAYTARCEHALGGAENDPDSFTAALRRHGADYLRP